MDMRVAVSNMNKHIRNVYKSIFNENFNPALPDNRLKMQSMVYLLQESGTSLGDYGFLWYECGLYCQALTDDMLEENTK
jgi:uncharacterized protein YwgA